MSENTTLHVWPLETGITDLPADISTLSTAEVGRIRAAWSMRKAATPDAAVLHSALDELNREWSIETGVVEGIFEVDRSISQSLIADGLTLGVVARGASVKDPAAVLAHLWDHMNSLNLMFEMAGSGQNLTVEKIKELHAALTRSQASVELLDDKGRKGSIPLVHGDWKQWPSNVVRDEKHLTYCLPARVASEMDRLVQMHNAHIASGVPAEVQAAWLLHRLTQIRPFQDGNGRVAHTLASMILHRANLFPVTLDRDDAARYIESLEMADAGDLRPLSLLIVRNQRRSYQRVVNAIERSRPGPSTLEEAVQRLSDIAALRDDARMARILSRISLFRKSLLDHLATAVDGVKAPLIAINPLVEMQASESSQNSHNRFHTELRHLIERTWQPAPKRPFAWVQVEGALDGAWQLVVLIHAVAPDMDESLQAVAVTNVNGEWEPIPVEPINWPSDSMDLAGPAEAEQWLKSALTITLGMLTRRLATPK